MALTPPSSTVVPQAQPAVRPSPLSVDAQASPLVLCKRGSASQLVFQNIGHLQAQQAAPMTLASHPGLAIVARGAENSLDHEGDTWCYNELGIGMANMALSMQFDGEGFLTSTHAPNGGAAASMVLDISWWQYEEGNTVNLVGEERRNDRSRDRGGRRTFVLNSDGTIGAAHQPHLVLGMQLPRRGSRERQLGGGAALPGCAQPRERPCDVARPLESPRLRRVPQA